MTWYYGATYNLEKLIATNLFIICSNNSGTSYLKKVLATSSQTWNLVNEGQHTAGFAGPSERTQHIDKLWATEPWLSVFTDDSAYSWPETRRAWYFQAFSSNPEASVFVEKTPQSLLNIHHLVRHFKNSKFIFMVRDPYATVEGIRRRRRLKRRKYNFSREKDLLKRAATQVMTCFQYQQRNLDKFGHQGVFFTYEAMCDETLRVENLIKSLVPELDDFVLKQHLPIKDYDEVLRNMNAQQLLNLTKEELSWINEVFEKHPDLLDYFGYPFRTSI